MSPQKTWQIRVSSTQCPFRQKRDIYTSQSDCSHPANKKLCKEVYCLKRVD